MQSAVGAETELAPKNLLLVGRYFRALLILTVVLGSVVFARSIGQDSTEYATNNCPSSNITVSRSNVVLTTQSNQRYDIEIAETPAQQELGLSNRPCFPANGALLFAFQTDDMYGIWMKNMSFNIDVIWLDSNKKAVHIEHNMQPSSYPNVFYSQAKARYVIELNAGQVDNILGAQLDTQFNW
ncbi:DUF192 domain-containing protein [bacterium]|nr:DUF192 domain-containing protein [bacterium]NBX97649.1 DUF192 domain-containing protein [bacterium]NDC94586.1 DUF192 domain-containing protein [bacterium]NDD84166.1 DUF192 domain-containing protein [bacterium]NDG29959.1 DUF192 domain-containing protein [bacterium]